MYKDIAQITEKLSLNTIICLQSVCDNRESKMQSDWNGNVCIPHT
jgi:hypothetical protein